MRTLSRYAEIEETGCTREDFLERFAVEIKDGNVELQGDLIFFDPTTCYDLVRAIWIHKSGVGKVHMDNI